MNGRVYDYNLGRFMSVDPFIQSPKNSQSINPYSYLINNPLSGIDPSGYCGTHIKDKAAAMCTTYGNIEKDKDDEVYKVKINQESGKVTAYATNAKGEKYSVDYKTNLDQLDFGSRLSFDVGQVNQQSSNNNSIQEAMYALVWGQKSTTATPLEQSSYWKPGDPLPQYVLDFGVGMGNAMSLGLGGVISEWVNGKGSFDRESDAFSYGGYAGMAVSIGTALRAGAAKFFYNPTPFPKISSNYWAARGGANGASLHHWLFPQSAKSIPIGIRNAGFNLVALPAFRGVFHRSLGLNQWMGFAQRWGGARAVQARAVENMIRVGIPSSLVGSGYIGYELGTD